MSQLDVDLETLEPVFTALGEIAELPCSECGETGDTLPCIECDKLVCDSCGVGVRWCKAHGDKE